MLINKPIISNHGSDPRVVQFANAERVRSPQVNSGGNQLSPSGSHGHETLGQILEIIHQLLEQHEVRLCMVLLQTLYDCQPLASAPLEAANCSVKQLMTTFVKEHQRNPNQEALNALALGLGSKPPKPPSLQGNHHEPSGSRLNSPVSAPVANKTAKVNILPVEISQVDVIDMPPGDPQPAWQAADSDSQALVPSLGHRSLKSSVESGQSGGSRDGKTQYTPKKTEVGNSVSRKRGVMMRAQTENLDGPQQEPEEVGYPALDPKQAALASRSGWWIIHPGSVGRLRWDVLGVLFIAVEAFLVPLSLGFDVDASDAWFWACTIYFMVDLCSQFTTGFYHHGNLVMRQSLITRHYLTGFFIIDLCATLPWEYMFPIGKVGQSSGLGKIARAGKLMRLFRLLRLLRLRTLIDRVEDILPVAAVLLLSLLKMLLLFALMCHWVACFWGYLGLPENVYHHEAGSPPHNWEDCEPGGPCEAGIEGSPWLHRMGLDNFAVGIRYVVSLQFAAGLLLGAEWPVSPGVMGERIFISFMMVFSFFLCSLVLSQIVVIVNELSESKKELAFQIRCMKEYMRAKKVPVAIQAKVRQYLEYQHSLMNENSKHSQQFLNSLSQFLRLEVMECVHGPLVSQNPFFQELPRAVLQRVCDVCESLLCGHQDVVVHRGQSATCMMFLVKGSWCVQATERGQENETLRPICWIGYSCLFKDMIWPNTCISIGPSELLKLDKEELLELFHDFPEATQAYQEYQARIHNGELITTGVKCGLCGKFGHSSNCCAKQEEEAHGLLSGAVKRATHALRKDHATPVRITQALMPTTKKLGPKSGAPTTQESEQD